MFAEMRALPASGAGPAASPKVDSLHLSEDDQDDEKDYDEMLSAREELDADAS